MGKKRESTGSRLRGLCAAMIFAAAFLVAAASIPSAKEAGADGIARGAGDAVALMMRAPEPSSPDVKEN
jgi:hypothetical protein